MMKTLGYFMSLNERRMSCLLTPDTEKLPYYRDLYVQGFINKDKVSLKILMRTHARTHTPTHTHMNVRMCANIHVYGRTKFMFLKVVISCFH